MVNIKALIKENRKWSVVSSTLCIHIILIWWSHNIERVLNRILVHVFVIFGVFLVYFFAQTHPLDDSYFVRHVLYIWDVSQMTLAFPFLSVLESPGVSCGSLHYFRYVIIRTYICRHDRGQVGASKNVLKFFKKHKF